jgi:voltage-gated potassium channel
MKKKLRENLFEIIFEADTTYGKLFDIVLLIVILLSLVAVTGESIPVLRRNYSQLFIDLEWIFTVIFGLEYILRIYAARNRIRYIVSFFGIIDLLAIYPLFWDCLLPGQEACWSSGLYGCFGFSGY